MEFRNRPKSNYLLDAKWQELHALTLHWQSDMDFFGDELRFMDLLFDKYFTSLVDKEHLPVTKNVASRLAELKTKHDGLVKQVTKHLHELENLIIDLIETDASSFRNEHAILEDQLSEFAKAFKKVKREAFQMTEQIVKNDKQKHLIGN